MTSRDRSVLEWNNTHIFLCNIYFEYELISNSRSNFHVGNEKIVRKITMLPKQNLCVGNVYSCPKIIRG